MSIRCEAITRQGKPCPNGDAAFHEGRWLCHIHHPLRTFRQQVAANRAERWTKKAQRKAAKREAKEQAVIAAFLRSK